MVLSVALRQLSLVAVSKGLLFLAVRVPFAAVASLVVALGVWASVVVAHGLSLFHVESSKTGDQTHVPNISRWMPIHSATREALVYVLS